MEEKNNELAEKLKALKKEAEYHANLYYNLDNPEISDAQYDSLIRDIEKIEKSNPKLISKDTITQKVGGKPSVKFSKVNHRIKMESLSNAFSLAEIEAFYNRVNKVVKNAYFVVEPKIDGVSVSLTYIDGVFVLGATRGDGITGEDITENLRTISSVPTKINTKAALLTVRGEVYMPRDSYREIVEKQELNGEAPFKNPRNAAAGSLRQKDPAVTAQRNLSVYIFNIQYSSEQFIYHKDTLDYLKNIGFSVTPSYIRCATVEDIYLEIERINIERKEFTFDTDGAVVKLDNLQGRDELGSTTKAPRWAIAYKYPPEVKTSYLRDVIVKVGRTGVLTPTAMFDPVILAGTTVSRASLHNQDFINQLDVRVGDKIDVHKAGDIIPEILKSYEHQPESRTFLIPNICPSCGTTTTRINNEAAIRCINPECPEQLRKNIIHFVSRDAMNIDGVGSSLIDRLISIGCLKTGAVDLYGITRDNLLGLEKIKEKSADNIISSIERSKRNNLDQLLFAFGIRNVGKRAATLLAMNFNTLDAVVSAKTDDIIGIEGIGIIAADSIKSFFSNPGSVKMINKIKRYGINTTYFSEASSEVFTGLTFAVTGKLDSMNRDEVNAFKTANGGKTSSSVSKNTNYIVAGEDAGSKLQKAFDLGIRIISEDELVNMVTKYTKELSVEQE